MTILDDIIVDRKKAIKKQYDAGYDVVFKEAALSLPKFENRFYSTLNSPGLSLIAEVKKASPSKGVIYKDFDPIKIASRFESFGASAFSVLTEPDYFKGDPSYLFEITQQFTLPALRKDFIVDPIQIYEARLIGASAILLIRSALSDAECLAFTKIAHTLGLDVLLEVHDEEEFMSTESLHALPVLWGVNNRNLKTFEVDLDIASRVNKRIKGLLGDDSVVVAESGYQHVSELERLDSEGFSAVLIGEGLARDPDLISYFKEGSK